MLFFISRLMLISAFFICATANAAYLELSSWSSNGDGVWDVSPDNFSVTQRINNGSPSVYFNNTSSQGQQFSGQMSVQARDDDDFIGFVLGYNAGDFTNDNADYLLIDWKQARQNNAVAGLSIWHVTGALTTTVAWEHVATPYFQELQRADTLGSVGWRDFQTYTFDILFTANAVQVFINDILQLSVSGSFSDGSFGLYSFSQQNVNFSNLEQEALPSAAVPEPSTLILFSLGLVMIAIRRKKWTF